MALSKIRDVETLGSKNRFLKLGNHRKVHALRKNLRSTSIALAGWSGDHLLTHPPGRLVPRWVVITPPLPEAPSGDPPPHEPLAVEGKAPPGTFPARSRWGSRPPNPACAARTNPEGQVRGVIPLS